MSERAAADADTPLAERALSLQTLHLRPGAAVVLARESVAAERGLTPLVSVEAVATTAMEPELMGYAPVLARNGLFEKTGTSPSDIGTIELNEAFASQAVVVIRDTKLDPAQVNPYRGAIALGHPVGAIGATGATGAIMLLRVSKDMTRRDLELGIVTMCIGGGQRRPYPLHRGPSYRQRGHQPRVTVDPESLAR